MPMNNELIYWSNKNALYNVPKVCQNNNYLKPVDKQEPKTTKLIDMIKNIYKDIMNN